MTIQAIPLSWTRRQCAGAVAGGLSLNHLYERALIRPKFDDDRDCISPAQLTLLYAAIVLDTEDESHALSRQHIPLGFGVIAFRVLFSSETVESAIRAVVKLYALSSSSIRFELKLGHDDACLAVCCEGEDGARDLLLEDCYLAYLFMGLSLFLGRSFPATCFATRDPLHMNVGGFHWSSGSPVRLGSVSGLYFPRAVLAARRAPLQGDDFQWQAFSRWLDFIERPEPVAASPEVSIQDLRASKLAADRGMSPATFRRVMNRTEGGFRHSRQRLLVDAGLDLLLNSNDSVDAIAAQLGYSEARSFRRFIKASTGRTPNQLRAGATLPRRDAAVHQRLKEISAVFAI